MSSPAIDDLPAEMICELFKHLNLNDLAACSMVNKRWHSLYAGFRVDRVVANGDFVYFPPLKWSCPDRKIEEKELCHLKIFNRLVGQPLLSNVKYLALCGEPSEFDLDKLSELAHLTHLMINFGFLGTSQVNLKFPKLKVLVISFLNEQCPLSIDCPELNVLAYRGEPADKSLLSVKHPETIRRFGTNMFGSKLAPFKNVECLKTQQFEVIRKDTLLSLPKLNELHYNVDIYNHLGLYAEVGKLDRTKETLNKFLNDVRALRGPDFRFRFAGFQLNKTKLNEIDFGVQVVKGRETVYNEYVYMKNYQLIDPDDTLDFVYRIDYIRLMDNVPGEIPVWFYNKFTGVQWMVAKGAKIQNESHFLCFLKSLSSLKRLELEYTRLSQEFYDQLPVFSHSLTELHLWEDDKDELQMNFDFIGKLSRLSELFIQADLTFESMSTLARWSGNLGKCFFYFAKKRKRYFIEKRKGSKVWQVTDSGFQKILETENPSEMVFFFAKL